MKKYIYFAVMLFFVPVLSAGTVSVQKGNIVYIENGKSKQLTQSGRDTGPVLSPAEDWIYFIRKSKTEESGHEIWRVRVDGTEVVKLFEVTEEGATGGKSAHSIQISPDGSRIYFHQDRWVTSDGIYVMNTDGSEISLLGPGSSTKIILSGEYAGYIVTAQHRYFSGGGSYDWYYLFTPNLEHEIAVLGEDPSAFIELYNIKFTDRSEKEFVSIFRSKD